MRRLVEAGLVLDTGERSSGRGRAGSYYALAPDCGAALVVSITPHGVVAEAVDAFGAVVAATEIALVRDAGAGAVGLALTEAVAEVAAADEPAPAEVRGRSAALRCAWRSSARPTPWTAGPAGSCTCPTPPSSSVTSTRRRCSRVPSTGPSSSTTT